MYKLNPFQMIWRMRNNTYIENISQLSHAIQCANLAEKNNHRKSIVLACLFHDIGHYDVDHKVTPMLSDTNRYLGVKNHEYISYSVLKQFGYDEETCQYVKNHVLSKRYLCTVDKNYYNLLSEQSKSTFKLQGGFLTDSQLITFERSKYFSGSLIVRSYDEQAKAPETKNEEDLYLELERYAVTYGK